MALYRVTFHTEILVDCVDPQEAEVIGFRNLSEEIRGSSVYKVDKIDSVDQLHREERGSLPWRSTERRDEPELRVEEILGGNR
jgi:hypothetical protein